MTYSLAEQLEELKARVDKLEGKLGHEPEQYVSEVRDVVTHINWGTCTVIAVYNTPKKNNSELGGPYCFRVISYDDGYETDSNEHYCSFVSRGYPQPGDRCEIVGGVIRKGETLSFKKILIPQSSSDDSIYEMTDGSRWRRHDFRIVEAAAEKPDMSKPQNWIPGETWLEVTENENEHNFITKGKKYLFDGFVGTSKSLLYVTSDDEGQLSGYFTRRFRACDPPAEPRKPLSKLAYGFKKDNVLAEVGFFAPTQFMIEEAKKHGKEYVKLQVTEITPGQPTAEELLEFAFDNYVVPNCDSVVVNNGDRIGALTALYNKVNEAKS